MDYYFFMSAEAQKKSYYPPEVIKKILPKQLKHFRIQSGLTTKDVAYKLNKTPSAVTLWETGKALPDIVTLLKLCTIYKVSDLNEFIELKSAPEVKTLSKDEQELIFLYRNVSKDIQSAIKIILNKVS